MPWKPSSPGEAPTLGYEVIDWIAEMLAAPDKGDYEPFVLYPEQEDFVLRFYELDPRTCKRRIARGLIGRPRGWGKSPFLAALACVEALGPVVPDGWDANGQPIGRPWSDVRTPLVHIAAVSEQQTGNTWAPLLEMLREGPVLDEYPGLEPMDTFVALPKGRIEQVTSSARTIKGARAVFAVLDQTEEWVPSNGGPNLAQKMRVNAAKVGGTTVESPNAFVPGQGSVAEASAAYAAAIREGRARDASLLYDHREAPPETDMADRKSLIAGLRVSYGDSSGHKDGCVLHTPPCAPGHVDLDRLVTTIWDPDQAPEESQSDFLNQITATADAFLSRPEWAACSKPDLIVRPSDAVVLGFDGSRGRAKGKPDATALIGCRVTDGHLFEVGVWEAPEDKLKWADWTPPMTEIESVLAETFTRYRVVGMYADPGRDWRSHVNAWESRWGARVTIKSTRDHPFEWWMTGGRAGLVERSIEQFEGAVRNLDVSHDGSSVLVRHILNARRRLSHGKLALAKESSYSSNKIDAAVAAVLAWQCRLDAVTKGAGADQRKTATIIRAR